MILPHRRRRVGRCRVLLVVLVIVVFSLPFGFLLWTRDRFESDIGKKEATEDPARPLHFIYTVGCGGASDTKWQLLQSTALDFSFRKVQQQGKLTRLVSGCTVEGDKGRDVISQSLYATTNIVFASLADSVLSGGKKKTYVQANRPTALREFFQRPEIVQADPNTVYIIIDPDFIFRKAIPDAMFEQVRPGQFVTHDYHLADPGQYAYQACLEAMTEQDADKAGDCERIKELKSFRRYHAGVPYMLLREDWMKLLERWIPLIGPVLVRYPGIESDMLSWAVAAAVAELRGVQRKDFMATCMSSESASLETLNSQFFLHLCQSYYLPETRDEQYRVNPVKELSHIVTKHWLHDIQYVYVFNKHWLKSSRLLEDCTVPLLIPPPPFPKHVPPQHIAYYRWHQQVAEEAVEAFNEAIVEYRSIVMRCEQEPLIGKGTILHEIHHSRYGGGWNHAIDL